MGSELGETYVIGSPAINHICTTSMGKVYQQLRLPVVKVSRTHSVNLRSVFQRTLQISGLNAVIIMFPNSSEFRFQTAYT